MLTYENSLRQHYVLKVPNEIERAIGIYTGIILLGCDNNFD